MKDKFVITVLIPCHSTQFLPQAIKSIRRQTLDSEKFKVLLVLDRVNRKNVTRLIKNNNINIEVVESRRAGIVEALNLGLELSDSEFIARMDEDDIMMPKRLEKQLNYMNSHPKCVAIGCQLRAIDNCGNTLHQVFYQRRIRNKPKQFLKLSPIAHPAAMIRSAAIEKVGGYRDFLPEDWDLWARLTEVGTLENLRSELLHYRVHDNQLSRKNHYNTVNGRDLVSLSYFARKEGLRDKPNHKESIIDWTDEIKNILTVKSIPYKDFILWKQKFEKYQEFREKLKKNFSVKSLFKIVRMFPIYFTVELFSKITSSIFYKVFLKS